MCSHSGSFKIFQSAYTFIGSMTNALARHKAEDTINFNMVWVYVVFNDTARHELVVSLYTPVYNN